MADDVQARQDAQSLADFLVDVGREQLRSQLDGAKAWDLKALGLLAFVGAAAPVLISNRGGLGPHWWLAGVGLGIAACGCVAILFTRSYDLGPGVREAYQRYGGLDPPTASVAFVEEFGRAIKQNHDVAHDKSIAFLVTVVGLVAAILSVVWLAAKPG